jgi:hypothetical protein
MNVTIVIVRYDVNPERVLGSGGAAGTFHEGDRIDGMDDGQLFALHIPPGKNFK